MSDKRKVWMVECTAYGWDRWKPWDHHSQALPYSFFSLRLARLRLKQLRNDPMYAVLEFRLTAYVPVQS